MNSLQRIGKTVVLNSVFNKSRLHFYSDKCVQNACFATDFKFDLNDGNKGSASNKPKNSPESDTFGSLERPMEGDFRAKINSQTRSGNFKNKKVIKLKRPHPTTDQADVFGNLSDKNPMWYPAIDGESKEENDLSDDSTIVKNLHKKFRCPRVYLKEMKRLVGEKKIKEALDLFVDMRRNFVAPILPHYTYMIGVCSRVGYTEMCFKLLRQMTDRDFKPTPATLTGLFNSCAESPFPEYGLKKAHLLKEKIEMKNWRMTQITYHAMIKAFGKCGDLQTAFKIVDDMAKADIKIDVSTYSFLLMSCIANKEAGFTYAVEVWRMMEAKKCHPNIFTINLLLRSTRDCDVGPEEISCLLLQHWTNYTKRPYGFATKESLLLKDKEPILRLYSESNSSADSLERENTGFVGKGQDEHINGNVIEENLPKYEMEHITNRNVTTSDLQTSAVSVLSSRPSNGPEIVEILNIKTPGDRLNLLGGLEGFLGLIFKLKVNPNIKTFTLLLECLPGNIEEEEKLLVSLDKFKIKPNIEFFNALIKRRTFRMEDEAAKSVLILINKYQLTPDIMTFGSLALGCRTLKQASLFINEMKKMGSCANIEILGCMAKRACMILDFPYMKFVLETMEEQEVKPDEKILSLIENSLSKARKNVILLEHGKEVDKFYQRQNLQADFKQFYNFYEEWLKRMKFQSEKHPWLQYKTDIIDRSKREHIG